MAPHMPGPQARAATGVAFSGLASVVALFYLFRGGYYSALNVLLTLVGAIPFGLAVAVLSFLIFGHVHMLGRGIFCAATL